MKNGWRKFDTISSNNTLGENKMGSIATKTWWITTRSICCILISLFGTGFQVLILSIKVTLRQISEIGGISNYLKLQSAKVGPFGA